MFVIESALRLLARALALEISQMSTSALALGVGLMISIAKIRDAYKRGRWHQVRAELTADTWRGARIALAIWAGLFFFFLGAAIFQDHNGLKALLGANTAALKITKQRLGMAGATCQNKLTAQATELGGQIMDLKQDIARKDGINQTLQTQNRDEQMLISGCQTEALKLLVPVPQKITPVFFDQDFENVSTRKMRWLVITNKPITPVHVITSCTQGVSYISAAEVKVVGGGEPIATSNENGRLSTTMWELRQTGTWSPEAPLLVTITYIGQQNVACGFEPR